MAAQLLTLGSKRIVATGLAVLALLAAVTVGTSSCGGGGTPTWRWGLAPDTRAALASQPTKLLALEGELDRLFGTPADPRLAPLADGSEPWLLTIAALPEKLAKSVRVDNAARFHDDLVALDGGRVIGVDWSGVLEDAGAGWVQAVRDGADGKTVAADGATFVRDWLPDLARSQTVYTRQCVTCHGREGGGDGPSATYLKPQPRDFRSNAFKYFHAVEGPRPKRKDLVDVLYNGISGSGMAAFRSLSAAELVGLSDYVRFLAVRGATETGLVAHVTKGGSITPEAADQAYADAWAPWLSSTPNPPAAADGTR